MKDMSQTYNKPVKGSSRLPGQSFVVNSGRWKLAMTISLALLACGIVAIWRIFQEGLGVMDISNTIFWGVLITNFVFWIGISHAGTFISAILLLLHQNWREQVNRIAEMLTILSIFIAALMPLLHLGRPARFHWLIPQINITGYKLVNFYSALSWDFYAIGAYLLLSVMFFTLGAMPDMALLRDSSSSKFKKLLYKYLSLGWTGNYSQQKEYKMVMVILAGIITAMVISVHSIVSLDFATTTQAGWHNSVYPLYFVTGAVMSGFAAVIILVWISSTIFYFPNISSSIEKMNKIILATSCLLLFITLLELYGTWYSGNPTEQQLLTVKYFGHYGWISWLAVLSTLGLPQLLWNKKIRSGKISALVIAMAVIIGMWLERFIIVVGNSEITYIASTAGYHRFSIMAVLIILGSIGLFACIFLFVARVIPVFGLLINSREEH
jgi:molybdopterin-containing oxidoreductase family membrane subunit